MVEAVGPVGGGGRGGNGAGAANVGVGGAGESKMTAHQAKKLDVDALLAFRDRFNLPLSDAQVTDLTFYRPADDSPEMRYLHARRSALGGYLPARRRHATTPMPPRPGAVAMAAMGEASASMARMYPEKKVRDPRVTDSMGFQ